MTIMFDIEYDEAVVLRAAIAESGPSVAKQLSEVSAALDNAIQNADERHGVSRYEASMESSGEDDSRYREQMLDAGRGHLLR